MSSESAVSHLPDFFEKTDQRISIWMVVAQAFGNIVEKQRDLGSSPNADKTWKMLCIGGRCQKIVSVLLRYPWATCQILYWHRPCNDLVTHPGVDPSHDPERDKEHKTRESFAMFPLTKLVVVYCNLLGEKYCILVSDAAFLVPTPLGFQKRTPVCSDTTTWQTHCTHC